jgi:hypothetical protein
LRNRGEANGDLINAGERVEGEALFASQESIVEYGLPFSRVYDREDELWRIRAIWARQAAMPSRPRSIGFNSNRSLRRG